jgi:hypothetical protein
MQSEHEMKTYGARQAAPRIPNLSTKGSVTSFTGGGGGKDDAPIGQKAGWDPRSN